MFWLKEYIISYKMTFTSSGLRVHIVLEKSQLSTQRSDIYLSKPESYRLERPSSNLVETTIFRQADSMLPATEKLATSCQRMQFLVGKISLSIENSCLPYREWELCSPTTSVTTDR